MDVRYSFNPRDFKEFIEQEIRLAMQQGQQIDSGVGRAAVAKARAKRITDYLFQATSETRQPMTEISQEEIDRISLELLNRPRPEDLRPC